MAAPRPPFVAYITGNTLLWEPEQSSFASLAAQMLGDAGSGSDGFDGIFNGVNQSIGSIPQIIKNLQDCLAKLQTAATNLNSVDTSAVDQDIAQTLKAIQATSLPIGAAVGGLSPPAAPTNLLGSMPAPPNIGVGLPPTSPITTVLTTAGQAAQTVLEAGAGAAIGAGAAGGAEGASYFAGLAAFLTNPVTIIIGVVALIGILAEFLGKGCGEPCIESSKLEQVYEVAADIIAHAVVLGMIPFAQWNNIYQAILQHGEQAFGQLQQQGDPKAKAGLANMQKVLSGLHPVAPAHPTPYHWQSLLTSWLQMTNTAGWYPDSLQSGEDMAQATLAQVLTNH